MAGASVSRRPCITSTALLLASLLVGVRVDAQASTDEAQIKAAFVYNFLKFVEWPADTSRGPQDAFVVLIIGDGATADATAVLLASKQIGERPLLVRRVKWDQSLVGVDAVFVAEHDTKKLSRILNAVAAAAVLTIGEGEDFATRGGMIGLVIENRRVRFDVNTDAAQASGLRVSSKLLALTRTIHSAANGTVGRP